MPKNTFLACVVASLVICSQPALASTLLVSGIQERPVFDDYVRWIDTVGEPRLTSIQSSSDDSSPGSRVAVVLSQFNSSSATPLSTITFSIRKVIFGHKSRFPDMAIEYETAGGIRYLRLTASDFTRKQESLGWEVWIYNIAAKIGTSSYVRRIAIGGRAAEKFVVLRSHLAQFRVIDTEIRFPPSRPMTDVYTFRVTDIQPGTDPLISLLEGTGE
jgi:hypothetical protein